MRPGGSSGSCSRKPDLVGPVVCDGARSIQRPPAVSPNFSLIRHPPPTPSNGDAAAVRAARASQGGRPGACPDGGRRRPGKTWPGARCSLVSRAPGGGAPDRMGGVAGERNRGDKRARPVRGAQGRAVRRAGAAGASGAMGVRRRVARGHGHRPAARRHCAGGAGAARGGGRRRTRPRRGGARRRRGQRPAGAWRRLAHAGHGARHRAHRRPTLRLRDRLHLDAGIGALHARRRVPALRRLHPVVERTRPRRRVLPQDDPAPAGDGGHVRLGGVPHPRLRHHYPVFGRLRAQQLAECEGSLEERGVHAVYLLKTCIWAFAAATILQGLSRMAHAWATLRGVADAAPKPPNTRSRAGPAA